jgi:hypothetical protein
VRFGSGAGYFAADIRLPSALSLLDSGSYIYGVPTAVMPQQLASLTYDEQFTVPGQTLPGFRSYRGLTITPNGSTMKMELAIYDRQLAQNRKLAFTFTGCQ